MNLSIHRPDPLIGKLDAYAYAYATAIAGSRSSVVREPVTEFLLQRSISAWPAELSRWMTSAPVADAANVDWPSFDAIRNEANANMTERSETSAP